MSILHKQLELMVSHPKILPKRLYILKIEIRSSHIKIVKEEEDYVRPLFKMIVA